jgi:hypothetical protein
LSSPHLGMRYDAELNPRGDDIAERMRPTSGSISEGCISQRGYLSAPSLHAWRTLLRRAETWALAWPREVCVVGCEKLRCENLGV